MIAMSIRESGRPLVDLRCNDGEVGTSGTVKEKPIDERIARHFSRIERHDHH
jgi:hypothetical protein